MTQEQQHLFMTIHSKLVSLKYHGEVTEQLVIRDIASDGIEDLIKLRDLLTSEKEGDLSDFSTKGEDNGDEGFNEFVKENYK